MPINGLLINLSEDVDLADQTLRELAASESVEVGDRDGRWQPVVVTSEGVKDSHDVHEWIDSLAGVVAVEVVFASVSDGGESSKV